jgi:Ribosomal protein L7/L12 C-terminal domain
MATMVLLFLLLPVLVVLLGLVIVSALVVSRSNARALATPTPAAPLSEATVAQISGLLRQEKKIPAIKVLREATGLGLADAKLRIDRWSDAVELAAVRPDAVPVRDDERLRIEASAILATAGWHTAESFLTQQRGLTPEAARALLDALD